MLPLEVKMVGITGIILFKPFVSVLSVSVVDKVQSDG